MLVDGQLHSGSCDAAGCADGVMQRGSLTRFRVAGGDTGSVTVMISAATSSGSFMLETCFRCFGHEVRYE